MRLALRSIVSSQEMHSIIHLMCFTWSGFRLIYVPLLIYNLMLFVFSWNPNCTPRPSGAGTKTCRGRCCILRRPTAAHLSKRVERSGAERNGVEWSGVEWRGGALAPCAGHDRLHSPGRNPGPVSILLCIYRRRSLLFMWMCIFIGWIFIRKSLVSLSLSIIHH